MPRPKRPRYIINQPLADAFKPERCTTKKEVTLSLEEYEAVRLIDYEGLDQSQAANIMNVSRQTFGRILKSGRYNLTKFVVEAHRLRIAGGCYKIHRNGRGFGHNSGGRRFGNIGNSGKRGYCHKKIAGSGPDSKETDNKQEVTK